MAKDDLEAFCLNKVRLKPDGKWGVSLNLNK